MWTRITRINTDKAKSMDNRSAYRMAISAWQALSCCMTFNRFVPFGCCSLTLYPFLSILSAPIRANPRNPRPKIWRLLVTVE